MQAQQGRRIGGRCHHHRACQAFRAENVFYELLDLASAFADQPHHDHVGTGITRHHAQQHALADTAAGKQAHALPSSNGKQGIDGTHAHIEHMTNRRPGQGIDRPALQGHGMICLQRPQVIERTPGPIDYPTQQLVPHSDMFGTILGTAVRNKALTHTLPGTGSTLPRTGVTFAPGVRP